jgi:hypothetical protein
MTDKWIQYENMVSEYERQGMSTSDAQGVADAAMMETYGIGWELKR